jgi:methionyl-tRNA synthetase
MSSGIPCSIWRYYLLANRPEANDSVFLWDDFVSKTNSELLANLGNLVNRTTKFLKAKFGSTIPAFKESSVERDFIDRVNKELSEYNSHLESVKIKSALKSAMAISALGNLYLSESKLDNNLFMKENEKCGTVLNLALNIVYLLSSILNPFIPEAASQIQKQLNAPERKIPDTFTLDLLPGHVIGVPFLLFQRIEEDQMIALRERYSGSTQLKQ